jgi:hypothetical protein
VEVVLAVHPTELLVKPILVVAVVALDTRPTVVLVDLA